MENKMDIQKIKEHYNAIADELVTWEIEPPYGQEKNKAIEDVVAASAKLYNAICTLYKLININNKGDEKNV